MKKPNETKEVNMKKKALSSLILAALLLLCGCGKTAQQGQEAAAFTVAPTEVAPAQPAEPATELLQEIRTCYVLDASERALAVDALYAKERDTWGMGMFPAEDAPEQMTVSFNGESFTGAYEYSTWKNGISHAEHCYRTEHTPEGVDFNVDAETGELRYVNVMTGSFFERQLTLPELDDPETETEAIAKEYAGMLVDIDEYDIHRVSSRSYREDEGSEPYTYFTHVFARSVNGMETTDRVTVEVTSKGSLASVAIGDLGVYAEAIKKAADIARIDVEGSVAEALSDYKISGGELTGEYSIEREYIALTPDGELVICAAVESGAKFDGAEETTSVGIVFLIYV